MIKKFNLENRENRGFDHIVLREVEGYFVVSSGDNPSVYFNGQLL